MLETLLILEGGWCVSKKFWMVSGGKPWPCKIFLTPCNREGPIWEVAWMCPSNLETFPVWGKFAEWDFFCLLNELTGATTKLNPTKGLLGFTLPRGGSTVGVTREL